MVRPTEEEKDLQKLQNIDDSQLRPEFVKQMQLLRTKVFRRVKPKQLNGRFISGETLFELAQAYVQAINKGSVPCIEEAWTSVCKNECQRGVTDALNHYKESLASSLSDNNITSVEILKKLHTQTLEAAKSRFKDKAIGESIEQYENEINDQINKQFAQIKKRFADKFMKDCDKLIQPSIQELERELRYQKVDTEQDLYARIENIKEEFYTKTKSIDFKEKETMILGICNDLLKKGSQSLLQREKTATTNQSTMLEHEIKLLKEDLKQAKADADGERQQIQDKYAKLMSESKKTEVTLSAKLVEMTENCRTNEQKLVNLERESDKVGALNEQKLFYVEKEKADLQERLQQAQQRISELSG